LGKLKEPKHTLGYYKTENNLMIPQHTHIINHNTSSVQISNPNINLASASTTVDPIYNDSSKVEDNLDKTTSDYPEFNEHYGPPPSYFSAKNKYENIDNPFADPDFDFDQFLASLRDDPFEEKPKLEPKLEPKPKVVSSVKVLESKPKPTTTVKNLPQNEYYYPKPKVVSSVKVPESKPKPTTTVKNLPQNEYYYYEDDDDDEGRYETSQTPKKIYSSQIKPTTKDVTKPIDDYYYEEEYDYPQKSDNKHVNVSKNGEMKYSSKYHGKPVKTTQTTTIHTTSTSRPTTKKILTSETYVSAYSTVSSTTQRPKYATRQRTKLTIPTTRPSRSKQRHRLNDDDAKSR
jgi:hypothetical protein